MCLPKLRCITIPSTLGGYNGYNVRCFIRSGPSISQQIKIWSTSEKEAEKLRRKDQKRAAKRGQRGQGDSKRGGGGASGGAGGLDWLQSVGFEDEYLKQVYTININICL